MKSLEQYKFADLMAHDKLIRSITQLENQMKNELGEDITLIAYTPKQQDEGN